MLITRRSLNRKYNALRPTGIFSPSNKVPDVSGPTEAAEALTLATLNVVSFSFMVGGGALWAFDISTPEELKYKLRSQLDFGPEGSEQSLSLIHI